jgi:transcriptional regulator with XRE-family HTH domain
MSGFGDELTRLMTARGLGVRELARRVHYNPGHISNLRNGKAQPSPESAQELDDALGADGMLAASALQPSPRVEAESRRGPACPGMPGRPYAPEVIAAIGSVLNAVAEDRPWSGRAITAVQRDVVAAWELRQSAQYVRLGSLLVGLLQDTGNWMRTADGEGNPDDAATAGVHTHNMVSSLLKRLEAFEMAAVVADRAFGIAQQTGSGLLIGAAKLRVANVYLSASCYAEAVAIAAGAADNLPPRPGSSPAEIATFGARLLTAAVAAAQMGEAAQAWEFLGHAKAAAKISGGEHADLFAVFGPVNLAVHGVQVATELGDSREALRRAERVDVGRMPAILLERRSTLLIDIARSQHRRRDHAASGETLLEAERLAPLEVRYSGTARSLLSELLSGSRASAELRQMAGRLRVAA